jgi:hypothetical protein
LERLVFAEKAGKVEVLGDRKFSNGTFQFYTDLKTVNWTDAKNAIERIEISRTRS